MVNTPDWLLDTFPFAVLILDSQHYVVRSNQEARRFFGNQAEPGSHFPQHLSGGQHRLPSPEAGSNGWVVDVVEAPDKHWLYVFREDAQVAWVSEDTERMAFEDPLTGLPNWNILAQFVDHSCSQAQRYSRSSALLRVDLDHLRHVNLELGRSAGDEVLLQAAQRLQNNVRSSDIVGRLEGDKFLVLLTELTADRGGSARGGDSGHLPVRGRAAVVANRLIAAFRQPFAVADAQIKCSASIGVAVCPEDARLANEWMETAELALKRAKENGGDSCELYAEALKQSHQLKKERHAALEEALRGQELQFRWLPALGPEALEHYWPEWPAQGLEGPEILDLVDSAGVHGLWARWEKSYLENHKGTATRLAPLASAWLNPGVDTAFLLEPGWLWEVDEGLLHHRYRLESLLHLQEKGLNWVLNCGSRGLQSLAVLGKLQPKMLKLPIPAKPSFEHERLLMASARVAEAFKIELLVALPKDADPPLVGKLQPRWLVRTD